jgi:hypothetical protein
MSLPAHLTNNASQLPFFCSSNSLLFYLGKIVISIYFMNLSLFFRLDDPTTISQVLTLYNPYEFAVRYKGYYSVFFCYQTTKTLSVFLVLCTAPRVYSIAEPQGEIRPQHSVDT